jgi:hypothetical protein
VTDKAECQLVIEMMKSTVEGAKEISVNKNALEPLTASRNRAVCDSGGGALASD